MILFVSLYFIYFILIINCNIYNIFHIVFIKSTTTDLIVVVFATILVKLLIDKKTQKTVWKCSV